MYNPYYIDQMVTTMEKETYENFEEMLQSSFEKLDAANQPGDLVTGTIVSYDDEFAYVDIGAKQESIADVDEFSPERLQEKPEISAYIADFEGSRIKITETIGKGFVSNQLLSDCYDNKRTVYGKITEDKKAGYTVEIGTVRSFCPKSQLSDAVISEYAEKKIKYLPFLIIEYKKNNCIVSNRALKEAETAQLHEKLKDSIQEGDVFAGSVVRIEKFGVFIRLENGLEGLVPKSELSVSKTVQPSDFSIGDDVSAEIITLDWDANKHAFSIKKTMKDPWEAIDMYTEGDSGEGPVTGMIQEGAFVEIEPGLEGFIHVSRMSKTKRVSKAQDVLTPGQQVSFTITGIEPSRKRISLDLNTDEIDPWSDESSSTGNKHSAVVEKITGGGLIVRLENGLEVYVQKRELEQELSTYPVGSKIEIILVEIDQRTKKAKGSQKMVRDHEEKQQVQSFISDQEERSATSSIGSMFGSVLSKVKEQVEDNDQT